MKYNTERIVQLAKEKSKLTRESVVNAIDKLQHEKKEITFASVAKEADVSRNYLYNSEEIRPIIEELREEPIKRNQTEDTKDLIIETQKHKISELNKELKKYESYNELELKYREALKEIEELKEQLKKGI